NGVAYQSSTARRQCPPERTMANVQVQMIDRSATDDGPPARRCRSLAGPWTDVTIHHFVAKHFARGIEQCAGTWRWNFVAFRADFDEAGDSHAVTQPRKYN